MKKTLIIIATAIVVFGLSVGVIAFSFGATHEQSDEGTVASEPELRRSEETTASVAAIAQTAVAEPSAVSAVHESEKPYQSSVPIKSQPVKSSAPVDKRKLLSEKIQSVINRVRTKGMTDFEAARAAYNWLFANFKYRSVAVNVSNGISDEASQELALYYFKYHKGSCEHYAAVQKLLLESLGFKTQYVYGIRFSSLSKKWGDHVWLMAEKDGIWYHVDGLYAGFFSSNMSDMFFVPDGAVESSHMWDRAAHPVCGVPAESAPPESTPNQSAPTEKVPSESVPPESTPNQSAPPENVPPAESVPPVTQDGQNQQ